MQGYQGTWIYRDTWVPGYTGIQGYLYIQGYHGVPGYRDIKVPGYTGIPGYLDIQGFQGTWIYRDISVPRCAWILWISMYKNIMDIHVHEYYGYPCAFQSNSICLLIIKILNTTHSFYLSIYLSIYPWLREFTIYLWRVKQAVKWILYNSD